KGSERQGVARTPEGRTEMEDRDYRTETRSDAGRFGRWLSTRPAETWMFFAVGVFLGGFFF
ncbi:MAG: hypothetical protein KDA39_11540, partial [Hyphomonas sp.]|nr:hypothetical protein [Hyphomonas sp.]